MRQLRCAPFGAGLPALRKARGVARLKIASLRHGHTFQQLGDLRGYGNLVLDMADDEPRLWRLIEMVEQFNLALAERDLEAGAQWMGYPEDLGMQRGPLVSPAHFRKYLLRIQSSCPDSILPMLSSCPDSNPEIPQ